MHSCFVPGGKSYQKGNAKGEGKSGKGKAGSNKGSKGSGKSDGRDKHGEKRKVGDGNVTSATCRWWVTVSACILFFARPISSPQGSRSRAI